MAFKFVGLAGSFDRPSKVRALVKAIGDRAAKEYGIDAGVFDLEDVGPSLGLCRSSTMIVSANDLVIGAPTFKGSYPGFFKHLMDLIEPHKLRANPNSGTQPMTEHRMRPLFGFVTTHALPTTVYASDRDFTDYVVSSDALLGRIVSSVSELEMFLSLESGR